MSVLEILQESYGSWNQQQNLTSFRIIKQMKKVSLYWKVQLFCCRAKFALWTKMTHRSLRKVQYQTVRLVKTVQKIPARSYKKVHLNFLVALIFYTKCMENWPFLKLCSSFLLENRSQEWIFGKRLVQILINTLLPKQCFLNTISFNFCLLPFQTKTVNFANMKYVEPNLGNEAKIQKSYHLIGDPGFLFMFQK